jgi:hypothetical protein
LRDVGLKLSSKNTKRKAGRGIAPGSDNDGSDDGDNEEEEQGRQGFGVKDDDELSTVTTTKVEKNEFQERGTTKTTLHQ